MGALGACPKENLLRTQKRGRPPSLNAERDVDDEDDCEDQLEDVEQICPVFFRSQNPISSSIMISNHHIPKTSTSRGRMQG